MKLTELDPAWIGEYYVNPITGGVSFIKLPSVDGAQGLCFICPKCGNHSVLCWFRNPRNAPLVPVDAFPRPGRWTFSGDTFEATTLTPSVDLSRIDADPLENPSRCYWHGCVANGEIR